MSTAEPEIIPKTATQTYLLINCETQHTSAALIKPVAGRHQFIAGSLVPSSYQEPQASAIHSVIDALKKIEQTTGHSLVTADGDLIRETRQPNEGVDFLGATATAITPMRISLLTDYQDQPAVASARRVISKRGAELVDIWTADDERSWQEQIDHFFTVAPDIVCLVGGDSPKAAEKFGDLGARLRTALLQFAEDRRPIVIFAGRPACEKGFVEGLGEEIAIHTVTDIRPQKNKERPDPLERKLVELELELKIKRIPGLAEIVKWGQTDLLSGSEAAALFARYRASTMGQEKKQEGRCLVLNLTDDRLAFYLADKGAVQISIQPELGLGRPLFGLLDQISTGAVYHWVEEEITPESESGLRSLLVQQGFHSGTVPLLENQAKLLEAVVKAIIQQGLATARLTWGIPSDQPLPLKELIVNGSVLNYFPNANKLVQIMLDGLAPVGTFPVYLDEDDLAVITGRLARENPLAAVQIADSYALSPYCWVVCPPGSYRQGKKVLTVKIGEKAERSLDGGDIHSIDLPAGDSDWVLIQPVRGVNIGFGKGKRHLMDRKFPLQNGLLFVDTRGRPFVPAADEQERREMLVRWRRGIGG